MKSVIFLALLAASAALHAHGAAHQHASLPPALAKAVGEFDRAQMTGDGKLLKRLLADDYVLVNSRALVEDKADFIHDYTAPGFRLMPYTVEEEVVRSWPGGAVLGGLVTLQGTSGGKPFKARLRFADIWREKDGTWQVIFTQATRVPGP
jgi:hypothetical protein